MISETTKIVILSIIALVALIGIALISFNVYSAQVCPSIVLKNGSTLPTYQINLTHVSMDYPIIHVKYNKSIKDNIENNVC